ncbi:TolC family protein [Bacteroides sp.]|uniref:TolC family protein n=1 Tax=Bacteroides sp. TaxID=29523 RepID=UPI0025BCB4B3|nr:TolC family protein [Bacteroides sp.]
MKCSHSPYLLLLLLFCSVGFMRAQEVSNYSALVPEDYTKIVLPTLDLLFENAKASPTYELSKVKEQIERKLLAKEKRAFLGFFSIRGSYQYGMFGNESTFTDVSVPPYLTYSTAAQNGYTIGGAVNIPLDGLFDLSSRIKRQKLTVRKSELETQVKFEEIKREIIELYATATAQLNVLKMRAEALVLANVQYDIVEKDFANGTIDSGVLAVEKERQSQAQERFENSKFELTKSLMILEVITRTPILSK